MSRLPDDPRLYGAMLKRARKRAGLQVKELAKSTGLSTTTIRSAERGAPGTSLRTHRRLDSVIGPIIPESDTGSLSTKWSLAELEGYCAENIQDELRNACNSDGGVLEYDHLVMSEAGFRSIQSHYQCPDYYFLLEWQGIALEHLSIKINKIFSGNNINLVCLTCGHGWIEYRLAKSLAEKENRKVIITMFSPSPVLLNASVQEYSRSFKHHSNMTLRSFISHQNNFLAGVLPDIQTINCRKVVCILGPLNNHDFDYALISQISQVLQSGDLILFDAIDTFTQSESELDIYRADPRMNGKIPTSWVTNLNLKITETITENVAKDIDVKISNNLMPKSLIRNKMSLYGIDFIAMIDDGRSKPWRVSGLRIYRQPQALVIRQMEAMGWHLVHVESSRLLMDYGTPLFLFSR